MAALMVASGTRFPVTADFLSVVSPRGFTGPDVPSGPIGQFYCTDTKKPS
jgi:hypothetical protein